MSVLKLGVNVDHVATLRQARGTLYPSPLEAARISLHAGAHSITMHLREDRRHIQDKDIYAISRERHMPLNLEMGNNPDILKIALELKPAEVCLVPERRQEITTEGGLNVVENRKELTPTIRALKDAGVTVSLFVEADHRQITAAAEIGAPFIELHTGHYCDASPEDASRELKKLRDASLFAHRLGLKVNAGHGINLATMPGILTIPGMDTLNIGHSIVARAVFVGLTRAVHEMLSAMKTYPY